MELKKLDYIKRLEKNEKFDKIVVLGDLYYAGPNYNDRDNLESLYVKEVT